MNKSAHAYWRDQTLVLHVYVQPRASRDELIGWHDKGLKIRLKAAPVDGEANKQLIKFLAKLFKVTAANISLLKGKAQRQKTVGIYQPRRMPDPLSGIEQ